MAGWPPSTAVPLAFGPIVACGFGGDIITGQTSNPIFGTSGIYGTPRMEYLFSIPSAQPSIQVAVCVGAAGTTTPGPLVITLFTSAGIQLAQASIPAAQISKTVGWTPFVTLTPTSPLAANPTYYLLWVSSPASTNTGFYWGFLNYYGNWNDPGATAGFAPPTGFGGGHGSSLIWVTDAAGNDLEVLPFGFTTLGPGTTRWVAASNYSISDIVPYLADSAFIFRPFAPSWTLFDDTTGQNLGTALQPKNLHGWSGLTICPLPSVMNIVQGHTYRIQLNDSAGLVGSIIRGSTVNPAKAAPGGYSPYMFGEIALGDFSAYSVLDYGSPHILFDGKGNGGIGGAAQVGVRFVPSLSGTLQSISLKMYNGGGTAGNYPAGTSVFASVFASNDSAPNSQMGPAPTGSALASASADSGTMPLNGFFNVSGFPAYTLVAGSPYWTVWSAPLAASNAYDPQRESTPFRYPVQVSTNSGASWFYPGQGPSDITFKVVTSAETIGNPYYEGTSATIDSISNFVAQPFILSKDSTVTAIHTSTPSVVRIFPDGGNGPNMAAALGSGAFNQFSYGQIYSGVIIGLDTPAPVKANIKTWIVFSTASGSTGMPIPYYWTRPSDPYVPAGYDALKTSSGGSTWATTVPLGFAAATTIFQVGVQPSGIVQTIPTTVTVSARPH